MKQIRMISICFVCLGLFLSAGILTARDDYTPLSKEKFEGGLKVLKENGYILIAYYIPQDSDKEIAAEVKDHKTMVNIVALNVDVRVVAQETKTGKEIEVQKISGDDSKKLTAEDFFKEVCTALGVYKGCAQFFGWK